MQLFDLTGKTALITGASSGLGWRFSEVLSQAGAKVIIAARSAEKLQSLAENITKQGGNALPVVLDVSEKKAVQAAIKQLESQGEKIDILINNAGFGKLTPVFEPDTENQVEAMLQTNVMGVWYMIQAVAAHMKNQAIPGSIINIASINGANRLREGLAGYAASKAAVIQLTKALVGELSNANIRINCIAPGLFHTPLTDYHVDTPEKRSAMEQKIPLGFVAEPKDLDGTLLYLACNAASRYVTGSCITVDGGISWGG